MRLGAEIIAYAVSFGRSLITPKAVLAARLLAAESRLEENADRIRLFYLPGYSPKLNPDEMLNQDVRTNAVGH